jgi:hypothetical protein
MANGKCRKVLQFNEYDFRHKKTLEILSSRPRNMTELVVNAILHYVSCPDAGIEYSKEGIRKIVVEVIQEMQENGTLAEVQALPPEKEKSSLAQADLAELGSVMSMFRNRG